MIDESEQGHVYSSIINGVKNPKKEKEISEPHLYLQLCLKQNLLIEQKYNKIFSEGKIFWGQSFVSIM